MSLVFDYSCCNYDCAKTFTKDEAKRLSFICDKCKSSLIKFEERKPYVFKNVSVEEKEKLKDGTNDGGKNSFYEIPSWVKDVDDLAEYLDLRGDEFNILKSLWINIGIRHKGTNAEREAKKCFHYAQRRVKRLSKP